MFSFPDNARTRSSHETGERRIGDSLKSRLIDLIDAGTARGADRLPEDYRASSMCERARDVQSGERFRCARWRARDDVRDGDASRGELSEQDLALTNAAFVNAADDAFVPYAELGDLVLFCKPHPEVERGTVALNGVQRKLLRVSTGDSLRVEPFT